MFLIEIIIGGLLAFAILYSYRNLKTEPHKKLFARTLVIVALIYLGFAILGLFAETTSFQWFLIELCGVLIYSIFAYLGIKKSVWFLAIGWLTHVFWDVLLHYGDNITFVPDFYPNVCIGFDIVFGVYIFYRLYFRD